MIWRIVQAALVAGAVGFCLVIILGPILAMLKVPIAVFFGGIFVDWGWAMGILAGLWFFFFGGSLGNWGRGGPPPV
jgi:uncharacterized membrane protein YvlD (DUF360 family)